MKSLGEILPQIVRGPCLQRFAVSHHRFDGVRLVRAREALGGRLAPGNDRNGGFVDGEIRIDLQHLPRFRFRFLERGVRGVPLLPEKFQRAQEEFGAQLPAHHAVPLIDQHRQIAVRLDPFRVCVADDRFRRRADHQRLFQLFSAADCDHRQFGRKSRHVRLFFFDEAARNQQRKRGVDVTRGLEPAIKRLLDIFPERPAVRPHNHASAHGRVVR